MTRHTRGKLLIESFRTRVYLLRDDEPEATYLRRVCMRNEVNISIQLTLPYEIAWKEEVTMMKLKMEEETSGLLRRLCKPLFSIAENVVRAGPSPHSGLRRL